jgi:hypothetical protein
MRFSMNKKLFAFLSLFAFIFSTFTVSFAQPKRLPKTVVKQPSNALATLLPASDGVINIDLKRLMNEALPQMFATNPEMMTEINGKITEVQDRTGIDLRQFEQVAVGIAFKQVSAKEVDFAPLILGRGKFNAGALLALAKMAAKGKYREEKIGDKTVYVFSAQEIMEQNKPAINNSTLGKMVDKALKSLKNEIAVTTYDDNTLAIGSLARVRETFTAQTRVNPSLLAYLNRKPTAVMSFGANTPNGVSAFLNLDNDEIGKILGGVRVLYGSMDAVDGNMSVAVVAKSVDLQNAKDMEESINGLQMVGKGLLSGSKGKDKEVYSRMIDNAKISRKLTEVMLDLQVPQSDINILLGKK